MIRTIHKKLLNCKTISVMLLLCLILGLSSVAVNAVASPNTQIYTITTPSGTILDCAFLVTGEFSQTDIDQANYYEDSTYPNASRQRSATGKYNCHSYAWYSTSSSNNIWIHYNLYYTSDPYYSLVTIGNRFSIPALAPSGSKVDYPSDGHSAIKYSSSKLISKWGDYGLYIHAPGYCPYALSTSLGYYN